MTKKCRVDIPACRVLLCKPPIPCTAIITAAIKLILFFQRSSTLLLIMVSFSLQDNHSLESDSYDPLLDFNWRDKDSWCRETWCGPASTRVLQSRAVIIPIPPPSLSTEDTMSETTPSLSVEDAMSEASVDDSQVSIPPIVIVTASTIVHPPLSPVTSHNASTVHHQRNRPNKPSNVFPPAGARRLLF